MNRNDARLGIDAMWRVLKRASLKLGYAGRRVDRDNVVLAGGDGVTTSHTLKAGWNQRWRSRVRWNNALRFTDTDNPYVNVDGGLRLFSGDITQAPYPGGVDGWSPSNSSIGKFGPRGVESLQYYELHQLRAANLSNRPTQDFSLRSNLTWGPKQAKWSIGANVRYRDAQNDDLDYTKWNKDNIGAGVNFWIAAAPRLSVMVGLDGVKQTTDAEVIVPVMDG
jgi:hypothetical protein